MRRFLVPTGGALAISAIALACGGGGGSGSPAGPSTPSATPVSISILGDRGNQSFAPNPAQENGTGLVLWRNSDNQVHRIVANDGSFDTGDLNPGANSTNVRVPADGTNYHCSLHPGMIGQIRSVGGSAPTCTGPYC